jgi:hypothetical protein
MAELTVTVFSHHFAVSKISGRSHAAVQEFARRYVQYGVIKQGRQWVRVATKVYAAASRDRTVYRFHINQMEDFEHHLKRHFLKDTEERVIQPYKVIDPVTLEIKPEWVPRDDQMPVIEYICADNPHISRFVDLQTGKGKSFITMYSAAKLRARAIYIFRPMYLDKWVIDIRKTYNIAHEDLMTVQGSGELIEFLELMRTGEWAGKVVLVSNKTFQNFLKLYEEHQDGILDMGYACTPPEFFEFVGSSLRVIDEVHQDFHLNFKIDLYSHVQRSVSLSATMISDDPFVERMQNLAYPSDKRYQGGVYDKYIATRAVFYQLENPQLVKYKQNSNYSHNVYEHSIMKVPRMLNNYIRIIVRLLETTWLREDYYKPGDRAVVFCASIDLCTLLTDRLQQHFTKFTVMRYVGSLNDPYDNLMNPDLRVTTHGSAGTAVDIPELTVTIMSLALKSSSGSLQNLGRLRKLKDGREPLYVYMNCSDIPKHIEYHEHRQKLLDGKTTNYRVDRIGIVV